MSTTTGPYSDCLTASWLAERLGVDPLQIEAMRRAGELIGVRPQGETEWLYPAWQLKGSKPRNVVPRLVAVARENGLDEARLHGILTARMGLTGRRRLADLVVEGRDEEVVQAVRSAG
jgi:hypothetical protein